MPMDKQLHLIVLRPSVLIFILCSGSSSEKDRAEERYRYRFLAGKLISHMNETLLQTRRIPDNIIVSVIDSFSSVHNIGIDVQRLHEGRYVSTYVPNTEHQAKPELMML